MYYTTSFNSTDCLTFIWPSMCVTVSVHVHMCTHTLHIHAQCMHAKCCCVKRHPHKCIHACMYPPTPTYQEYQQEQAEPQARSAHHRFSGSVKPGWQQWQKSTHSASTCCQHSRSALKQSNTSVVSTLDQHWNSAMPLLSALWMSSEIVQHFCCQHSRSALK